MDQTDSEFPKPGPALEAELRGVAGKLGPAEQELLLQLARDAVNAASIRANPPELAEDLVTPALREPGACFVTLHKHGELRGCIGQITATRPLHEAVVHSASGAALRDPRFAAVQQGELMDLDIEISVLTPPVLLKATSVDELLGHIEPSKHGVLFRCSGHTSTFLPQVWQTLTEKTDFMDRLARKAGLARDAWRDPLAEISVYEVDSFESKAAAR